MNEPDANVNPPLDEQLERDLAALADGSLEPSRRREVEARIAASPELQALLAEQRSVVAALARDDRAPARLRSRSAAGRPRGRRRLRLAFVPAAVAVAALALVLLLPEGAGEHPSVASAAALSKRAATEPPPAQSARSWRLLDLEAEGVHYPNWERNFGWRAVGSRSDRLGGRNARTLFYEKGGQRIGYTIVSGSALPFPRESRHVVRWGTELASTTVSDMSVVTWRRKGRTCVLAGKDVAASEMFRLGAWKVY